MRWLLKTQLFDSSWPIRYYDFHKFDLLGLAFGLVHPITVVCGRMGSEKWRTDEEHHEYCVEEGFQLTKVKFNRNRKEGRETQWMRCCSINIWNELELKLDWSEKNSSYFENNFRISLLSGNSNTSVFKVCDVLQLAHFLVIKTFSNIFCSNFCWIWQEYNWFPIFFI